MFAALLTLALIAAPQAPSTIVSIIVHGNQIVSDEEVLKMSGLTVGAPFTDSTLADVRKRLEASGKFESIEVLRRDASITDPSKVTIVINASEGAVRITNVFGRPGGGEPRVVERSWWRSLMGMAIFDAEDGYGLTYGARLAYPGIVGPRSRVSFPLTWGGTRRAGAELERTFTRGPFSRVEFGGAIQQRRNPAYEENDRRLRTWARAERAFGDVRAGGTVGWQRVTYAGVTERFRSIGADVTFDTRLDPVLPRNAVYVNAGVERLFFEGGDALVRTRLDARGFVGVIKQHTVVVRLLREDANSPQPQYLRYLLGGWSNLRGFEAGFRTGDTLMATSLEYRVPISSPLSAGKLGVSAFVDWGTAYEKGERLRDQTWRQGFGGSVWLALTGFRLSVGVAHGKGASTRVTFGGGLTF